MLSEEGDRKQWFSAPNPKIIHFRLISKTTVINTFEYGRFGDKTYVLYRIHHSKIDLREKCINLEIACLQRGNPYEIGPFRGREQIVR